MRNSCLIILLFFCMKGNTQVFTSSPLSVKGWYAEAQAAAGHSWYSNFSRHALFHLHYRGGINLVKMGGGPVGFGVGLAFNKEGASEKNDLYSIRRTENAYYIKVPMFARFLVNRTRKTQPFADAGVEWGFFTGGLTREYNSNGKRTSETTTSITNETDLGLLGNIGVMHQVNRVFSISGFAGYYHGLSQKYFLTGGKSPTMTNRNVRVGIGLARKL
ncbi:outer membrane beta-barrel protein [Niabella sp.]|uniref:outer membrane beta-barrel protein n=1 Tax=Niabella sp. TaxID=1962976 RepID=UPI002612A588|nr:outer membrane beta-barrel protein [Niabella sp.]